MMKFYTVLIAGAMMAGSVPALSASQSPRHRAVRTVTPERFVHPSAASDLLVKAPRRAGVKKVNPAKRVLAMAENDVWRPSEMVVSIYMGEWYDVEKFSYAWDAEGHETCSINTGFEDDAISVTETTYDEYGMWTQQLSRDGESFDDLVPSERQIRRYDERVHSLCVYKSWESYVDGEWVPSIVNEFAVTRDAAGNITSVEALVPYGTQMVGHHKYEIEYGADGKASKITYYEMGYDSSYSATGYVESVTYGNIEWYQTDGQIYDMNCIFEGANKVKSFDDITGGEQNYGVSVTYTEGTDNSVITSRYADGVATETWTALPNGGYAAVLTFVENVDTNPYTETLVEAMELDKLGNATLELSYGIYDGELELGYWAKGEETLDDNGYPLEYTSMNFYADEEDTYGYLASRADEALTAPLEGIEGEWEPYLRLIFNDYAVAGTAAIDRVQAAPAAVATEYYTIDGRRVQGEPAPGLYIRRDAAGATKVLVK